MPVKNEEEAYEKIMDMSNNNDHTTGNLLDFGYFKKKIIIIIAIDLSKQLKLKDPQQISFIGKLFNRHGGTMFFIVEILEETTFKFSHISATII